MERLMTFVDHHLNFFPPIYFFLLVSIRRPFYSSHLCDSSARGTGPLVILGQTINMLMVCLQSVNNTPLYGCLISTPLWVSIIVLSMCHSGQASEIPVPTPR